MYDFKNFGIRSLRFKIGSKYVPYSGGLELNYQNDLYMQGYNTLFQCLREAGNDIAYEEYKNGYSIYAFDFSADLCSDCEQFSDLKDGSLDLDIDFAAAIARSLTGVFYLEFDNVIEINKQRNVVFDYQI